MTKFDKQVHCLIDIVYIVTVYGTKLCHLSVYGNSFINLYQGMVSQWCIEITRYHCRTVQKKFMEGLRFLQSVKNN